MRRFPTVPAARSSARLWCLVLLLGIFSPATAAEVDHTASPEQAQFLFQQANQQYQQQNFSAARDIYAQLVQQGIESPELYYNLGNASARLGRTGEAVLYFEKSRELDPSSPDVKVNLARVAPPGYESAPFVLSIPFHWVLERLSQQEWMGTFLVLFLAVGVIGGLLLSRRLSPSGARVIRPVLAGVVVLACVTGVFAFTSYYRTQIISRAVVMTPDTVVRSGPGDNFTEIMALPEGAKLRLVKFDDPVWARVSLPAGQPGYLRRNHIRKI